MKIDQSQLAFSCKHKAESDTQYFSTVCVKGRENLFGDYFRQQLEQPANPAVKAVTLGAETPPGLRRLFEELLAALREILLRAGQGQSCEAADACQKARAIGDAVAGNTPVDSGKWVRLDFQRTQESETTTVCAQGYVRTADGREISFRVETGMAREAEFTRLRSQSGSLGRLLDPLVLNFSGHGVELAGQTFSFDLNADGQKESVPLLGAGSAFVVFDQDGDGRIGDGKEVLGAISGSGFDDLKRYDQDQNGWLDEGDAAYSRLRLWMPEGDGPGKLQSLAQAGVGAISLEAIDSPFSIKDSALQTQGVVRQSGLWLAEDGRAGSLQQVDLSV